MLYSIIFAVDITCLINFSFHCFLNSKNFSSFGWVFTFILFGVPFFAPLFAIISAFTGSESWLRLSGNMNSMCVCVNYPVTFLVCLITHDDPMYLVMIVFMLVVKCCLSAITAKIRMYLNNPRFAQNNATLTKIMTR